MSARWRTAPARRGDRPATRSRPRSRPPASSSAGTVDELSARLDVPARAKESAARAKDTAVETYRESPPLVIGAALALVGLVVGLVILRRKRAASVSRTRRKR